ncbi:MAG: hypothetical protein AB1730_23815 [Myxococcota bacterium]
MRTFVAATLALLLTACPTQSKYSGPPIEQLYYPTGLVHVDRPGLTEGVLFVANANFDKRYATGSVVGFKLDDLGLPPFGSADAPPQLNELKIQSDAVVQVASFTGEMAALMLRDDALRLFVPSRSEGNMFQAIDVTFAADGRPSLSCMLPPDAPADSSRTDCLATAPSLTRYEFDEGGVPRAPVPFGVATRERRCSASSDCGAGRSCDLGVCRSANGDVFGDVWVTHLSQADSPLATGQNLRAYAVRMDSDRLALSNAANENFIDLGPGATNSVALGKRWAYFSGRTQSTPRLMRLVERTGVVWATGIEEQYRVLDARGVALASDEKRLYLVGRVPDSLLVLSIDDATSAGPLLRVARAVSLPDGATEVRTIPRPGRSDLVAVTCSGGGVVVLYDDDVGDVVAQVQGVGLQPFGLAVARRGQGARLFVSNFSDGRVTIIDIADLDRPQEARIAGYLGLNQLCLTRGASTPGCQTSGVTQ